MKQFMRVGALLGLLAWAQMGYGQTALGKGVAQAKLVPKHKALAAAPSDPFRDKLADGGVLGPEMVVIPPGGFMMGSPDQDKERRKDEVPPHQVNIVAAFALSKTAVTRGQFRLFVKATGHPMGACHAKIGDKYLTQSSQSWLMPGYKQTDEHPVVCVNWDDAKAYVAWLSAQTGKSYRLPSEAEWEYAARGGREGSSEIAHYWGSIANEACSYANVGDLDLLVPGVLVNKQERHQCHDKYSNTAPVGKFKPNGLDLYDMLGNVWQWTEDCWHTDYTLAPRDGGEWKDSDCNSKRVRRGGSWSNGPSKVRSAFRGTSDPNTRGNTFGFRVARTLP